MVSRRDAQDTRTLSMSFPNEHCYCDGAYHNCQNVAWVSASPDAGMVPSAAMEDSLRSIARPPEAPCLRDVPPNDLGALLLPRVPIIVIESRDEPQVLKALVRACPSQALGGSDLPLFQWSVTDGLKRIDRDVGGAQRTVAEPADVLRHIRATNIPGVFALLDFHPYMQDPTHGRLR